MLIQNLDLAGAVNQWVQYLGGLHVLQGMDTATRRDYFIDDTVAPLSLNHSLSDTVKFFAQVRRDKIRRSDLSQSPFDDDQIVSVSCDGQPSITSWKDFSRFNDVGFWNQYRGRVLGRCEQLIHALLIATYLKQDIQYSILRQSDGAYYLFCGDETNIVAGFDTVCRTNASGHAVPSLVDLALLSVISFYTDSVPLSYLIYSRAYGGHELGCFTIHSLTRFSVSFWQEQVLLHTQQARVRAREFEMNLSHPLVIEDPYEEIDTSSRSLTITSLSNTGAKLGSVSFDLANDTSEGRNLWASALEKLA